MLESVTYATVGSIATLAVLAYWCGRRARVAAADRRVQIAARSPGCAEPVTLHPSLDENRCISIGACADACLEGDAIAIVDGTPQLVDPSRCIGHGFCVEACPVDALTLVLGNPRQGVDVPRLGQTLETNVTGLYVAGELGGVGLIRNAVEQGRRAVDSIARSPHPRDRQLYDVAIVGAGPAGISATLQAQRRGLRYVTFEQDDLGGAVLTYPRHKVVMTQPMDLPLYGKTRFKEIRKEELLELWKEVIGRAGVEIRTREKVESISRNGHFKVATRTGQYRAKRLLLTIGRRGTPRKLGVPGEDLGNTVYRLVDSDQYRGQRVLVVGGGDSAVEAALALCRHRGTRVTLSYRRGAFTRIKAANRQRIEEAVRAGAVDVRFESVVCRIERGSVDLDEGGRPYRLPNDYVLVFAGGEVPTAMLKSLGVAVDTKFGDA